MLVNITLPITLDPILAKIAELNGNSVFSKNLTTGIYEDGSFNFGYKISESKAEFIELDNAPYF